MNGIRLNEAFGDTVNWDLIPTNAIDRADMWTNNPVFGLNALGGAVNLQMKNGFTYQGFDRRACRAARSAASSSDGAVWRAVRRQCRLSRGAGVARRRLALPIAGQCRPRLSGDLGWRDDAEPSCTDRRRPRRSSFGAAAATPVDLLELRQIGRSTRRRRRRDNSVALARAEREVLGNRHLAAARQSSMSADFSRHHVDGNAADIERCSNSASPQFRDHLCLQDDGFPRPNPVTPRSATSSPFSIRATTRSPARREPATPAIRRPTARSTAPRPRRRRPAVSLQATEHRQAVRPRAIIWWSAAASITAASNFQSSSTLGFLNPDLVVAIEPRRSPATGRSSTRSAVSATAPSSSNEQHLLRPLRAQYLRRHRAALVDGRRRGSTSPRSALQRPARDQPRASTAAIPTRDLNPVAGLTYKLTAAPDRLSAAIRKPTARRRRSSWPAPIRQALPDRRLAGGRSAAEAGRRPVPTRSACGTGRPLGDGEIRVARPRCSARTPPTTSSSVASTIQGRGFFQNVPGTRRQGLEAGLQL